MRQGYPLSDSEIQEIISLLENTDMATADIAATLGCTRRSVYEINKKYSVRAYESGPQPEAEGVGDAEGA